jgi:hypothetical protein
MEFIPPRDLHQAKIKRTDLQNEIGKISYALRQPWKEIDGRPMTDREYYEWRPKAEFSVECKLAELRLVKEWIEDYHKTSKSEVHSGAKAAARIAMNRLCDYVDALETELGEWRTGARKPMPQVSAITKQ